MNRPAAHTSNTDILAPLRVCDVADQAWHDSCDVLVIGWAVYLLGSLMLLANALALGGWERTQAAFALDWVWACALYAGVLGTAVSNVGWYHVIGKIGQSQASPHLYWLAVFGMLSSVLTLGESLSLWHGIGLALLVAGIRLGSAPVRLGAGG